MVSPDPPYCAARAVEERRLAMEATEPRARRAHLEMAAQYALQAGDAMPHEPAPAQAERKSA